VEFLELSSYRLSVEETTSKKSGYVYTLGLENVSRFEKILSWLFTSLFSVLLESSQLNTGAWNCEQTKITFSQLYTTLLANLLLVLQAVMHVMHVFACVE